MGRNILVPIDSSSHAQRALEHALNVHSEADITVFHVIEYRDTWADLERPGRGGKEGWYSKAVADAEELFQTAESLAEKQGVEISTVMEDGVPAEEIVSRAEEENVDQIVMGSHGRSGASRLLLGSVAEYVIRHSNTPKTIIH